MPELQEEDCVCDYGLDTTAAIFMIWESGVRCWVSCGGGSAFYLSASCLGRQLFVAHWFSCELTHCDALRWRFFYA